MRVKICGITNLEDALDAIEAGADALGFVFYEPSPRFIRPIDAKKIVEQLPPFVQTVGLFVNESSKHINDICHVSGMQLAQIIDDENTTEFENLEIKFVEVVRVQDQDDLKELDGKFVLVDAFVEGFGGAGKRIETQWFKDIDTSKMIIAGGLNANNLQELNGFDFFGVDVSSGVEAQKGKKDKQKMIEFVKAAHEIQK